ncbi:thymocyte nuclear protein 1 isoform X4 [Mus musculus]|nr:thymocyte nuclear protein 1 isoform X4 [Mus musculus]|eukprot:XP_006510755.1 PREDICTED: thymocyte nuclear protein 1 isoform X4 [Mus musculus]
MPRPRKRQTGTAGPDRKKLSGKRTKTENSESTSVKLENSSLEMTTTFKNGGKNLSNYWLMKSEPESRLEKVQHRGSQSTAQADSLLGWCSQLSGKEMRAGTLKLTTLGTCLPPPSQSAGAGPFSQYCFSLNSI